MEATAAPSGAAVGAVSGAEAPGPDRFPAGTAQSSSPRAKAAAPEPEPQPEGEAPDPDQLLPLLPAAAAAAAAAAVADEDGGPACLHADGRAALLARLQALVFDATLSDVTFVCSGGGASAQAAAGAQGAGRCVRSRQASKRTHGCPCERLHLACLRC